MVSSVAQTMVPVWEGSPGWPADNQCLRTTRGNQTPKRRLQEGGGWLLVSSLGWKEPMQVTLPPAACCPCSFRNDCPGPLCALTAEPGASC